MTYQLDNHNGWRTEGNWIEQQLIGSALIYGRESFDKIKETLNVSDFKNPKHQVIFGCMLNIYSAGGDIDLMTLNAELSKKRYLGHEDLIVYLSWLIDVPVCIASVEYGIGVVKGESLRARIQTISRQAMEASANSANDIPTLLSAIQTDILSLSVHNSKPFNLLSDIAVDAVAGYEAGAKSGITSGILSGLPMLDGITCGFWPSDLIIIAARPSMGKTALAITAMRNQMYSGRKPMFFSLEMAEKQIVNRFFSIETGINLMHFRTQNFSKKDMLKISEAGTIFDNSDLVIDDTGGITVDEIGSKLKQAIQRNGVDIAYIDYLQLVGVAGKKSRNEEIGAVTRQLKKLAKDLNIPIVALSQLSRGVENRDNKRPLMADLRDSGEIEQDADVIGFIYRDAVYNQTADPTAAEIIVAKQRNGPIASIATKWNPQTAQFM